MREPKRFKIEVNNAGGPIQLLVYDEEEGGGLRLLGSKGSPYATTLHKWGLSEEQLKKLITDLQSMLPKKTKRGVRKCEKLLKK